MQAVLGFSLGFGMLGLSEGDEGGLGAGTGLLELLPGRAQRLAGVEVLVVFVELVVGP